MMSDPPLINPNYLATQADLEVATAIFRRMRQAWSVPQLREHLNVGDEYYPGDSVQTDQDIEQLLRATLSPVSHATSTCKMGRSTDPMAVVDSKGRVYGTKNCECLELEQPMSRFFPAPIPQGQCKCDITNKRY